MADIDIPFNFDPVENKETTASYTVPAGKYSIISVTLSVTAYGIIGSYNNPNQNSDSGITATANSQTLELKLKTGETLTKVETPASGASGSFSGHGLLAGVSIAQALVDGNVVSTIRTEANVFVSSPSTSASINISGTADVTWHIAEYNSIT